MFSNKFFTLAFIFSQFFSITDKKFCLLIYSSLGNEYLDNNIFLYGPKKSGKSHLLNIWKENNNAIIFNNNFQEIINLKKNVAIDNILENVMEEKIFHIINHCKIYNLKILTTSSINLNNYNYKFKDLFSRLRSFYYVAIKQPDEEICKILMTKLFHEKQIIIIKNVIFRIIQQIPAFLHIIMKSVYQTASC